MSGGLEPGHSDHLATEKQNREGNDSHVDHTYIREMRIPTTGTFSRVQEEMEGDSVAAHL